MGTASAVSAPLGTASATHSFTVTNLDLAGDGSANDTVVFSYLVTATNGLVENITGNPFSYGVDGTGDPNDNEIDNGEGLLFDQLGIAVPFGDPTTDTAVLNSANFTSFDSRFPGGGDIVNLTDGSGGTIAIGATPNGGANDPYDFDTPQPTFEVTSGGGNGFGLDSITATFDIEVVPEPSSAALLFLSQLGLLLRRRR